MVKAGGAAAGHQKAGQGRKGRGRLPLRAERRRASLWRGRGRPSRARVEGAARGGIEAVRAAHLQLFDLLLELRHALGAARRVRRVQMDGRLHEAIEPLS
eukprot:2036008-Prymnesium_polylepis.1